MKIRLRAWQKKIAKIAFYFYQTPHFWTRYETPKNGVFGVLSESQDARKPEDVGLNEAAR